MAETSTIEWTDATWQPITGCSVVSPGCTNCYAMGLAGTRLRNLPSRVGLTKPSKAGPVWTGEVRFNQEWLTQPLQWRRPRKIFVCAHGDLFHEGVPDAWIDRVFAVMALCPQHTFQVLTKRSARMRAYIASRSMAGPSGDEAQAVDIRIVMTAHHAPAGKWAQRIAWPLPNVWLGVSAEDQRRADERIPDLLATPAAVRFVSAEPLLGPINLKPAWLIGHDNGSCPCSDPDCYAGDGACHDACERPGRLDWIIVGGESGPNARPLHPAWARSILAQCAAAGTAFLFKQHGAYRPVAAIHEHDDRSADAWLGADERRCVILCEDGRIWPDGPDVPPAGAWMMERVGKHRAGRLLDGLEHNGMPEVRHG